MRCPERTKKRDSYIGNQRHTRKSGVQIRDTDKIKYIEGILPSFLNQEKISFCSEIKCNIDSPSDVMICKQGVRLSKAIEEKGIAYFQDLKRGIIGESCSE
jgi:hypothetical protein